MTESPGLGSTLLERLFRHAEGVYSSTAAIMIITQVVNGTLIAKLQSVIIDDRERNMAWIDWDAAIEISGQWSRGERQLLDLAASLAGSPVSVRAVESFSGLDQTNARIVLEALSYSLGGWSLAGMLTTAEN